jgi:FkbM family methyltransferase
MRRRIGLSRRIASGAAAGLVFRSDADDAEIFLFGNYEVPIQEALCKILRAGNVFFDVGANAGFFSLLAARQVGATGAVYSFEPVPQNAECIEANAARNGLKNIHVVRRAVSDRTGVEQLYLAKHGGGAALATCGKPPDLVGQTQTETTTLDEWVAGAGIRPPDVVKIDVEGAEQRVLAGMEGLLARCRPILLLEFDDCERSACEGKVAQTRAFLQRFGYISQDLRNSYGDEGWFVRHIISSPG